MTVRGIRLLGILLFALALTACGAPSQTASETRGSTPPDSAVPRLLEGGPALDEDIVVGEITSQPEPARSVAGVSAAAYVVMDAETGKLLAEHQAHERRSPASLTKIMTALLVVEGANLDDIATVDEAILNLRFSTLMGIIPGEQLSVRNLLYGLLMPSGNDAAIVLARHISGTEARFVVQMNRKAQELGLWNTSYANPHGLDSRNNDHYTTAYDLALLTRTALRNPIFQELVSTKYAEFQGALQYYTMGNGNDLLWNYPGADGVKVGYTRRAGHTIVASSVRDGRRVIAVALGTNQRTLDAWRLLDAGFRLLQ